MPEPLLAFRGPVSCRRTQGTPQLSLTGRAAEPRGEEVTLAFSTAEPPDFSETLADAIVENCGGERYRVRSGAREWHIAARAVHLHFAIAPEFYRAIPPRPAPWGKRAFWRIVLALAGSRAGLTLLKALRR